MNAKICWGADTENRKTLSTILKRNFYYRRVNGRTFRFPCEITKNAFPILSIMDSYKTALWYSKFLYSDQNRFCTLSRSESVQLNLFLYYKCEMKFICLFHFNIEIAKAILTCSIHIFLIWFRNSFIKIFFVINMIMSLFVCSAFTPKPIN